MEKRSLSRREKLIILGALALTMVLVTSGFSAIAYGGNGNGRGNPQPGVPHDTIMIHIQPMTGESTTCDGGHSLHIGAYITNLGGNEYIVEIPPTNLTITMQDWVGVDDDEDGAYGEDPVDGVDNDGDGATDEDPMEGVGYETRAIDCDSRDGDGKVSIQIRDTDPRRGWISTQTWYIRLVGKPVQEFSFTSYGNHTYNCISVDPGPDGITGTEDDTYQCDSEVIELGSIDLSKTDAFKKAGNGKKTGWRFVDITELFLVDVDVNADDTYDLFGVHIFSVSCDTYNPTPPVDNDDDGLYNEDPVDGVDNDGDGAIDEDPSEGTFACPLGSIIWDIDEEHTGRPTIQIFISHDGTAQIVGAGGGRVRDH